jgi:site-specific recombinase XerD
MLTLTRAIDAYLDLIASTRSNNTVRAYKNALQAFGQVLCLQGFSPDVKAPTDLSEDAVSWFAAALKDRSPATEHLYLTAISGFYEYLAAEHLAEPNLSRLHMLVKQRARRLGQRLPQFPRDAIENIINYIINITNNASKTDNEHLRNLRDRAFLITLADTGLRVHEACGLRRGDLDWNENQAIIIGKGNYQSVVRFSSRAIKALNDYLTARACLDGASGRPLGTLPLFARHDRGAGKKLKSITTTTGRNIVAQRVLEALGPEAAGTITPHSFRHYFVTTVLRASGNLKLAQELARHRSIAVTSRYAHLADDELDQGYWEIFDNK